MPIRRLSIFAVLVAASLAAPAGAAAGDYVPGTVIVKYRDGIARGTEATIERGAGTRTAQVLPGGSEALRIEDGDSVRQTIAELRRDPNVEYAVADHVARAAQWTPNDPGVRRQWNLFGEFGIGMPEAWSLARAAGAPGGRGAVVAVVDSGVAYEDFGRFRKAPDLRGANFVLPYDFVGEDRHANDVYGHGTHVAGTIAQATNNDLGVAGVAYAAKIMPLRALNKNGEGQSSDIARAIRYAARHRADVINLSLEFLPNVESFDIPDVLAAIRYAHRRGSVVVAAAGNYRGARVVYPARAQKAIAVGATTVRGCLADYSSGGHELDIVAPGGGADSLRLDDPYDAEHCTANGQARPIYQQTYVAGFSRFGLPDIYEGTSMAAPHVSGAAALVIATQRLGPRPTPKEVQQRLELTARDLGPPSFDGRYGWGLVDVAAALRADEPVITPPPAPPVP